MNISEKETDNKKQYVDLRLCIFISSWFWLRKQTFSGAVFTWENLSYQVPVRGGQKKLLQDIFGYVKPGSMTALMGASGAGMVINDLL